MPFTFNPLPVAKQIAPFAVLWLLAVVAAVGSLVWSVERVDQNSRKRDDALIAVVIKKSMENVAHVQESSTLWDDAVLHVAERPVDMDWLAINAGEWFHTYAGHDEVYILDANDVPIYAMREGKRTSPRTFENVAATIKPLISELRTISRPNMTEDLEVAMQTPGVADLAMIHGQPSIVSVKPFASDSGKLAHHPGTKAVHVSVQYLDTTFLRGFAKQYGFAHARTSVSPQAPPGMQQLPLLDRKGRVVSYLVWQPFQPGADVLDMVAPSLLVVLLLLGISMAVLVRRLEHKSRSLEQSEAQAQHRALHDSLTGLRNRAMFEKCLPDLLQDSAKHSASLALLYLDIDHFKQVNDQLGHVAGDQLIQEVGLRLARELRPEDSVYRLGGDEFAIILNNPGNRDGIERICQRIVSQIGEPYVINGALVHVGVSIGVALAPGDAQDEEELARRADIALYWAKANGRGRHAYFRAEMDEAIGRRSDFDREMRAALQDHERQLEMVYQPVWSVESGKIVGVEALLRWHHPERGVQTPGEFGHLAEESGLIEALGEWVLETVARDAGQWPEIRVAVNVSPTQLRLRGFSDKVLKIIAAKGLSPERLELELTESALLSHSEEVAGSIRHLRQSGILFALDDFGTGFSSLSHIRDFDVDRIKIDRSFIAAAHTPSGEALVHGIVTMAKGYGLQVTAEGVENRLQGELVRKLGCDEVQGYFYARPLSCSDLTRLMDAKRRPAALVRAA